MGIFRIFNFPKVTPQLFSDIHAFVARHPPSVARDSDHGTGAQGQAAGGASAGGASEEGGGAAQEGGAEADGCGGEEKTEAGGGEGTAGWELSLEQLTNADAAVLLYVSEDI